MKNTTCLCLGLPLLGWVRADKMGSGDRDRDGLDDAWEQKHFGSLAMDGTDDPDGDGLDNRLEFTVGANPTQKAVRVKAEDLVLKVCTPMY